MKLSAPGKLNHLSQVGIVTLVGSPAHSAHEYAQSSLPRSPLSAGDHQLFSLGLSLAHSEFS